MDVAFPTLTSQLQGWAHPQSQEVVVTRCSERWEGPPALWPYRQGSSREAEDMAMAGGHFQSLWRNREVEYVLNDGLR